MRCYAVDVLRPGRQPAYLANGLVGLRPRPLPFERGSALVNGFVGESPEKAVEEYAEAPWPLGWDCRLGPVSLSERPDLAQFESESYDFATGEHSVRIRIRTPVGAVRAEVLTFCSRTQPTLIVQETEFVADSALSFVFETAVELRGCDGRLACQARPQRGAEGVALWESRGRRSTLGIAYATQCESPAMKASRRNAFGHEADRHLTQYTLALEPGRPCRVRKVVSLVPGVLHDEPHWQAYRMIAVGLWRGFDLLRQENRAAWAELWKGRVRIESDNPAIQAAADAAFFYLHSSVHQCSPCSVAPFGLGQRSLYSGHVFWDCETFMFPPVLFAQPEAARSMLEYRFRRLDRARDNARLQGFRGVQFPWQSGLTGCEVTPFYHPGGTIEHHVNLDVALAFAQYAHATGDDVFIRERAWPVLQGVAEWIASRAERTPRGFEIRHVTGIAESRENVDNSAFTNMAAIVILREAAGFARRLGYPEPASWREVGQGMFIPMDPVTGAIRLDDSYEYKGGMCYADPMAAYFPFGYRHSPAVDEATARFYMAHAETYLGMPMLSALFGAWACQWGERALARRFFELGILTHRVEPFHMFNEVAPIMKGGFLGESRDDTVFLTNPAGFLMALVMGLPAMRLHEGPPDEWFERDVVLPEGWTEISVERLFARGLPRGLLARHGRRAQWV